MQIHARLYGIGSDEYVTMRNFLYRFSKENGVGLVLDEVSDVELFFQNRIGKIPAVEFDGKIFWSENQNELLHYLQQLLPKSNQKQNA